MIRFVLSVALGVVAWLVVATIANLALRFCWAHYAAVEVAMTFTLPMLLARLSIGALSSIGAGLVTSVASRSVPSASWSLSAVLPILFIPVHVELWDRFPAWFHVTFLASLLIVPVLAASAWRRMRRGTPR